MQNAKWQYKFQIKKVKPQHTKMCWAARLYTDPEKQEKVQFHHSKIMHATVCLSPDL